MGTVPATACDPAAPAANNSLHDRAQLSRARSESATARPAPGGRFALVLRALWARKSRGFAPESLRIPPSRPARIAREGRCTLHLVFRALRRSMAQDEGRIHNEIPALSRRQHRTARRVRTAPPARTARAARTAWRARIPARSRRQHLVASPGAERAADARLASRPSAVPLRGNNHRHADLPHGSPSRRASCLSIRPG